MSYSPINVGAFVAAYTGAISGMATNGWLVDPIKADYTLITQIAGAFAQAFDIVWANEAQLNNLENQSISQIVSENFGHRNPGPQIEPRFSDPENWLITATACAALVLQSDVYFAAQGIDPGTGGGGGGSIAPLSNVFFVDQGFSGTGSNGSIATPFPSVMQAVNTVISLGIDDVTIYLTPHNYRDSEARSDLPPGIAWNFIGLTDEKTCILPSFQLLAGEPTTSYYFENCDIGSPASGGIVDQNNSRINFKNVRCFEVQGTPFTELVFEGGKISSLFGSFAMVKLINVDYSPDFLTDVTISNFILIDSSYFGNLIDLVAIICRNSTFVGDITALAGESEVIGTITDTQLIACHISNFHNVSRPLDFRNCDFADFIIEDFGTNFTYQMDSASITKFASLLPNGSDTGRTTNPITIRCSTAGESSFKVYIDSATATVYNFVDSNRLIIPADVSTSNRIIQLASTGGQLRQLFIIDCYGTLNGMTIQQASNAAVLYTFTNNDEKILRATFRLLDVGLGTFELLSVEKLGGQI
jgi:hypothetical protein